MPVRIALRLMLLLAFTSPALAGFTRVNPPNPDDAMGVHIYKLDNGLTVYLTENHEEPRIYAEIAVRAGSKNDPPESTGLAHYLEHMLFKGTQHIGTLDYAEEKPHLDRITQLYEERFKETDPDKRKALYDEINKEAQLAAQYEIPNEIDKLYKAMGATDLNAHTWHEETVYQVNLPSNRLEQWAAIESERFEDPVFRLFQPELEVVYEEKNRTLDNKDWLVEEAAGRLMYKKHPYGQQTTIGRVQDLKNPSLKNMYMFYNTYYVPNNMAICISGDIDIDATIQLIDKYFSAWQPKKLPEPKTWKEASLKGVERDTVRFQGEEYVLVGFRTVPRDTKDTEAIKLLDMILDNRTAGLINLNLVQKQLVRAAGSYPDLNNDYGAEYLWGIPKKGQTLADVEQLLRQQIDLVKRGEFDDWILDAIVTDFKKTKKSALESNPRRVSEMRDAFLSYTDWDYEVEEIDRMEKLTKKDIVRVADKYFDAGSIAVDRIDEQHELPKIEKPHFDKIDIDPTRQSDFAKQILAMPVTPTSPTYITDKDYTVVDVKDGVKLYYEKNPINDLFSMTLSVDMGTHQDNRLAPAGALMDKAGADSLSAEALKKAWYKLGTDFSMNVGDDETSFRISGLDENFVPSLDMMHDAIAHPTADQATLNDLVHIVLAQREDEKKDPRTLRDALRLYSRYGTDSRYNRRITKDALQKLTADSLLSLVRQLPTYQHTWTYIGTKPLNDVLALVQKYAAADSTLKTPPPYEHLFARTPAQTEIRYYPKETAQSQVFIEFGDVPYDASLRPAIDLYNDYFSGGMAGIVFQELREARALAYSTFARYDTGARLGDQNLMWGYIGCQADKTPEAVQAFIDLMDNMPQSPERFDEAKTSVLNRYRTDKIGFRDIPSTVRIWERRGLSPDPRKARFESIQQAGFPLVQNFQMAHIKDRPKLISIVGDTTKFDLNKLANLGKPIPVSLDDMFSK